MKELREHNECLLLNILPAHVAQHFLERERNNEVHPPTHTHTVSAGSTSPEMFSGLHRNCTQNRTSGSASSSRLCWVSPTSTSGRSWSISTWSASAC